MRRFASSLLILLLILADARPGLHAEEDPPSDKRIEALRSTLPLIEREQKTLEGLRRQLDETSSEVERAKLEEEIAAVGTRLEELRDNFRTISSGVTSESWTGSQAAPRTLNDELQDILQPLLDELRDATAAPREMEALRDDLGQAAENQRLAEYALRALDNILAREDLDDALTAQLRETRKTWQERLQNSAARIDVLEARLAERERNTPTLVESFSGALASFWKSRGLNLLLALAALVVTLLALRRLYRLVRRFSPFHRKGETRLTARTIDLLAGTLAILSAIAASLVVFFLRGDWLLLSLAAIVLAAIAIASRNSLPPYLDQIRTILNLGPVREGERLLHDGVPWRVDRLGFYCHFSNPLLGGGTLRLPIRKVNELYSRPCDHKEPWFPTRENDWVVLSDDTFGKIVQQTPERITVLRLGGSRKTYPTADFLALAPENLSTGFRVNSTFGIDYAHQAVSTDEVPRILTGQLQKALIERFGPDVLHNLAVEFKAAGPSSLDYALLADFTGDAAPRFNAIQRLLQRLCVEVCNEHGWTIPFTQVTVHQAGISVDPSSGHP